MGTVSCKCLSVSPAEWDGREELWHVTCARFYGLNSPLKTDFKLPRKLITESERNVPNWFFQSSRGQAPRNKDGPCEDSCGGSREGGKDNDRAHANAEKNRKERAITAK